MTKLNQIIAVEKGVKSRSLQELTEAHHALQKPALLSGITRTYRPRDEEGEQLPPESTRVQIKAEEIKKGRKLITLGIGDPDLPTPGFVIDRLYEAAKKPANHQHSYLCHNFGNYLCVGNYHKSAGSTN